MVLRLLREAGEDDLAAWLDDLTQSAFAEAVQSLWIEVVDRPGAGSAVIVYWV